MPIIPKLAPNSRPVENVTMSPSIRRPTASNLLMSSLLHCEKRHIMRRQAVGRHEQRLPAAVLVIPALVRIATICLPPRHAPAKRQQPLVLLIVASQDNPVGLAVATFQAPIGHFLRDCKVLLAVDGRIASCFAAVGWVEEHPADALVILPVPSA